MNENILFSSEKFKTSTKCEEFAKTKGNEFVKHTNFQLIRIYPHAVNQLSQNYDPIMPWANGCQVGTVFYHGAWPITSTLTAIIFLHYSVATKIALEILRYTMCRVRL